MHKFATQYFNLPSNHIPVIQDAVQFVKNAQSSSKSPQYDYIVHDVFTGGAEPAELFTFEFLSGLHSLLKTDGVIAIVSSNQHKLYGGHVLIKPSQNYAGDLTLYPTGLVVRTVQTVFPSCRIFREEPAGTGEEAKFTNMVLFCKKTKSRLQFRDPVPADYLRSDIRKSHLLPTHELDPAMFASYPKNGKPILVDKEVGRLHKFQDRSALAHWSIMRNVLPDAVWENW